MKNKMTEEESKVYTGKPCRTEVRKPFLLG